MTPEEIEELRALVVRLNGDNMAAILGAALEHIHKQDARIAELEGDLEQEEHNSEAFMNKIGEHVCEIVDLETKIAELEASLDEAAALTKKNVGQINALLAQVAALQEIAVELKAEEIYPYAMPTWDHLPEEDFQKKILGTEIYREYPGKKEYRNAANRMLAEEHPEAFR